MRQSVTKKVGQVRSSNALGGVFVVRFATEWASRRRFCADERRQGLASSVARQATGVTRQGPSRCVMQEGRGLVSWRLKVYSEIARMVGRVRCSGDGWVEWEKEWESRLEKASEGCFPRQSRADKQMSRAVCMCVCGRGDWAVVSRRLIAVQNSWFKMLLSGDAGLACSLRKSRAWESRWRWWKDRTGREGQAHPHRIGPPVLFLS